MTEENQSNQEGQPQTPSGGKNKTWAVLSYFWVISVVVLLTKKDDSFAYYHAKQGVSLFLISLATMFLSNFLGFSFFFMMPLLGLIDLGLVILSIVGIINASNGEQKPLPIIGGLAENLNF
jgi:uncharacterized membrane protein